MNAIQARYPEFDRDATIVCICQHGGRSAQVADFLDGNGFTDVINLTGGMHAWALQVDSSMPIY
jgi:rhodanese-related sulfurtransferase